MSCSGQRFAGMARSYRPRLCSSVGAGPARDTHPQKKEKGRQSTPLPPTPLQPNQPFDRSHIPAWERSNRSAIHAHLRFPPESPRPGSVPHRCTAGIIDGKTRTSSFSLYFFPGKGVHWQPYWFALETMTAREKDPAKKILALVIMQHTFRELAAPGVA